MVVLGNIYSDYDYGYNFGDDITVSCTAGRCGTETEYDMGSTPTYSFGTSYSYFRGNMYEVVGTPTLDELVFELAPASSCIVDLYVHVSDDSGATWSVLWSDEVTADTTTGEVSSGVIGLPLADGEWVALGAGWDGPECGSSMEYWGYVAAIGDDFGVGTYQGVLYDSAYGGYDSAYDSMITYAGYTNPYGQHIFVSEP